MDGRNSCPHGGDVTLGFCGSFQSRSRRRPAHLGEDTRTVADIALAVGYETESAFAKVFKRHLGATPGVYRRQRRKTYVEPNTAEGTPGSATPSGPH